MAGDEFIKEVKTELDEVGRVCGMRAVYNIVETVCVTDQWIDANVGYLLSTYSHIQQVVLFKAGMNTLSYRIPALKNCNVYEIDVPTVIFLKRHMIKKSITKHLPPSAARDIALCACTIEDSVFQSDEWLSALDQHGWMQSQPSIFIMQDVADDLKTESVEHMLQTILMQTMHGSAVLFNTSRMMDEKTRVENWLKKLGFHVFDIDELKDKKIHGGCLSSSDPGFRNQWLIACET